jgi:hypothetical protein
MGAASGCHPGPCRAVPYLLSGNCLVGATYASESESSSAGESLCRAFPAPCLKQVAWRCASMPSAESPQMRRCGTSTRLLAIAVVSSLLPSAAAFGAGGSALAGLQSLRPVRLGHASLGRAAAARTAGWSMEAAAAPTKKEMDSEIQRRRTFAIISHPDAGKTTLTEKLLLCGAPPQPRPGTKLCYGNGTYLPFDADTAIEQEFRGAQVRRRGAGGGYCEGQGRAAPRHLRLDVNRAGALLPTPHRTAAGTASTYPSPLAWLATPGC